MIQLTEKQILMLHDKGIERYGGSFGIRDQNLFKSCCVSPFQTMFGMDLYPDVFDKAVCYLKGFVTNQVFVDGNKRTGAAVALVFLRVNGIELDINSEQLYQLTMDVANNRLTTEDIKRFFVENIKIQGLASQ